MAGSSKAVAAQPASSSPSSSSSSSSRMTQLANIITTRTKQIEDYLGANGLPQPSFDISAPAELFPFSPENDEIQKARTELIDATQELKDLATGAKTHVMYLGWDGNYNNLSLQAIWHYKIATAFPPGETISYAELSKRTGVVERHLRRLCRHAMTNRLFIEPKPGYIAHTRASKVIYDDPTIRGWVGLQLGTLGKPAAFTIDAIDKWPGSEEPLNTGIQLAYNTEKHWFQILGEDPQKLKDFSEAMKGFSEGPGYELDYLVNGYPWDKFGEGTVVDVGGGIGFTSVALAKAHPKLKFINQDLPGVISDTYEDQVPKDLRDRVSFMPYDFFTRQPVDEADAYVFRWIFHGWSDAYAVRILRSQIPSLKKGARIIINEWCLPQPGTGSLWDERLMRVMDLVLITCVNSNERDLSDWRDLFTKADPRFTFLGSSQPEGCKMWITEAVWDPDKEFSAKDALPTAQLPLEL